MQNPNENENFARDDRSRSNPSQDRVRGFKNFKKYTQNLTEVCQVPVLSFFHNQVSKKLEVIGDSSSVSLISHDSELLNKLNNLNNTSLAEAELGTLVHRRQNMHIRVSKISRDLVRDAY